MVARSRDGRAAMERHPRPDIDDCRDAAAAALCRCQVAVTRAYGEMLSCGVGERVATDVAVRVYRHHHPGASTTLARDVVETWVFQGRVH